MLPQWLTGSFVTIHGLSDKVGKKPSVKADLAIYIVTVPG